MNTNISGILVVDKEKGMTSHDVVSAVRRRFALKKVGHAGTLDPNATGVLVLLIGDATKLSARFLNDDKEYVAVMKLGEKTDSADLDGKLLQVRSVKCSKEGIHAVMRDFSGEIEQIPPMVSAKRKNGQRLYKLARMGMEIERAPVKIMIKQLELTEVHLPFVNFRTVCSKGTYIRQLADDMGERLGCGAHLVELKRIRSGRFLLKEAVSFADLLKMDAVWLNENIIRV
ncbi:MAG: tRNA pseudouridine(55) synthase TruB [Candidatus Omnitrophota bacterium]